MCCPAGSLLHAYGGSSLAAVGALASRVCFSTLLLNAHASYAHAVQVACRVSLVGQLAPMGASLRLPCTAPCSQLLYTPLSYSYVPDAAEHVHAVQQVAFRVPMLGQSAAFSLCAAHACTTCM